MNLKKTEQKIQVIHVRISKCHVLHSGLENFRSIFHDWDMYNIGPTQ